MDLVEQLKLVFGLQELELQISHQEKELKNIGSVKKYQENKQALAVFTKEVEEKEKELKQQNKRMRNQEMELQQITVLKDELHQKLYGGERYSAKELENMEKKIHSLEKDKTGLEEEILNLMEIIESAEAGLKTDKGRLVKEGKNLQRLKMEAKKDIQLARGKLADLAGRREELIGRIDKDLLKKYWELSQHFQGRAVSLAKKGYCGTCNVSLPSSFRARLLTPGELVFCENCGCLLVSDD
jgi:predicted  nucleic acid-binding Zn-ribbon protein